MTVSDQRPMPWASDYEPQRELHPDPDQRHGYDSATFTVTITLECSARYSDAKGIVQEIADSLEWLRPGEHHAILVGTWTATPEVTHWEDR